MVTRILDRARQVLAEGARLPATPGGLGTLATGTEPSLGEYLALDDTVIHSALIAWQEAPDPILKDLCRRLVARHLFKTYELHDDQIPERFAIYDRARELASAQGLDPDHYVGLDAASDTPFDDTHDSLTVHFRRGPARKPGDVSFLLGRLRGQRMERIRLIFAPELRDAIVGTLETE
jgi:hypothetical protein